RGFHVTGVQTCALPIFGPSPDLIDAMGDKSTAKETMKKAGVPTIPGSDGLLNSVEEGQKLARKIGYPVILKATAGGGGKGMRIRSEERRVGEGRAAGGS